METAEHLPRRSRYLPTAIALGLITAGVTALLLQSELKWAIVGVVGLILAWLAVVFDTRRFLLGMFILSMPLVISKTLIRYQFHQGGAQSLDLMIMDIFLIALYGHWFLSWATGNKSPKKIPQPFVYAIAGFFAFIFLSLTQASDLTFSALELSRITRGFLIFFYMAKQVDIKRDLRLIIIMLMVIIALQATIAVAQYAFNSSFGLTTTGKSGDVLMETISDFQFKRVTGSLTAPNALASYLGVLLSFALGLLMVRVGTISWLLTAVAAALGSGALVLTMGRGAWASVAFGAAVVIIIAAYKKVVAWWLPFITALTAAIALVAVNYGLHNLLWLRLFASDPNSITKRLEMTNAAVNVILKHPLIGIGLNNYTEVVQLFGDPRLADIGLVYVPVHNSYLLMAAEIGIPGLACFLGIIFAAIVTSIRRIDPSDKIKTAVMLGIIGGCIMLLLNAVSDWVFHIDTTFYAIWLLAGLAAAVGSTKTHQSNTGVTAGTAVVAR